MGKNTKVRLSTLDADCKALGCQLGDVLECRRDDYSSLGGLNECFAFLNSGKDKMQIISEFSLLVPSKRTVVIVTKYINCDVCAWLFSAADRCFPRARLQSPRESHSAGPSDTCYSRRSQRSSAPNNRHVSG
ncbi:helix-turn-helix domain-containing protein [Virgibacillus profundi]|uniref:helix-turn-helix domain-containing protein n=1 Tax=Virgibacillus profundi TaxID=2024555 RepID=UPI000D1C51A2|nr:helix-turn-helix domain-containing protein [Virgibacillus profundi]